MASIVQTVTLDPVFMQEIKEDDRQLRLVLDRFRELVFDRSLAETDRPRLARLVMDVRDRLAFHFTLEEAYGYFDDPVTVAPRLSERVEELRVEHDELYADLGRISDLFEDLESFQAVDLATFREMSCEFLHRFDLHEAAENALISQAFNEDIGVGD